MASPWRLRSFLVALVGGVAYYLLLDVVYYHAPYADMPHGWREHLPSAPVAVFIWFTLVNLGGALLAAIPVSIGIICTTKSHRASVGFVAGAAPAAVILVSGFLEYGVPHRLIAWMVDVAQYVSIAVAVVAVIALLGRSPLTIVGEDRDG